MSSLILEGVDLVDLQCDVGVIADVTAMNPLRLLLAIRHYGARSTLSPGQR
jgi:hypothetical protein